MCVMQIMQVYAYYAFCAAAGRRSSQTRAANALNPGGVQMFRSREICAALRGSNERRSAEELAGDFVAGELALLKDRCFPRFSAATAIEPIRAHRGFHWAFTRFEAMLFGEGVEVMSVP